jgi:tRNA threonylcarbamoyladenosine biosynthesis protein TsaB
VSLYLALDTATDLGSVAIGSPGGVLAELTFSDRRHAAALMPAIDEALHLAGADWKAVSGIVVADGPGSFTGLRIGVATVKGILAVHDGLELRSVPSLLGLAWAIARIVPGPVAALYDALRGDVFAAVYDTDGATVRECQAPTLLPAAELASRIPCRPAVAAGDGAVAHSAAVRSWTGRDPVGPPAGAPRASALVELLAVEGVTKRIDDIDAFEPTYGRRAAAQDRWEAKHGRPLPDPDGD